MWLFTHFTWVMVLQPWLISPILVLQSECNYYKNTFIRKEIHVVTITWAPKSRWLLLSDRWHHPLWGWLEWSPVTPHWVSTYQPVGTGPRAENTLVQPRLSCFKFFAVLILEVNPKFLFRANASCLTLSAQNWIVLPHHLSPWTFSIVLYISLLSKSFSPVHLQGYQNH